jgi:cytochrome P450
VIAAAGGGHGARRTLATRRSPVDPITAVTHPDPYPYYADLVAARPLHRDAALGLWVAAGAEAVRAALTSPACRVRPAAEPVPRALVGSAAGELFGHLVRMNDGAVHVRLKPGVSARLGALDPSRVAEQSARWARHLADELAPARDPARVADVAFRLPVYAVASLLGVADGDLPRAATWTGEFVACLAPGASPEQVERGAAAATQLTGLMAALLRRDGLDAVVANTVGYLSQAYEATAGLVGNTLLALAREQPALARVRTEPAFLGAVVREVARHDSPVQNTRRFLAEDAVVAGQALAAGEAVLVVLAAANRDPAANPEPARFDPLRRERTSFTFGHGPHACPGEALAIAVAQAGVAALLTAGVEPERLAARYTYRPSVNTRIPLFDGGGG